MGPALGLGKTIGRGFKPHSEKTQLAIGDPDGANTGVSALGLSQVREREREREKQS